MCVGWRCYLHDFFQDVGTVHSQLVQNENITLAEAETLRVYVENVYVAALANTKGSFEWC